MYVPKVYSICVRVGKKSLCSFVSARNSDDHLHLPLYKGLNDVTASHKRKLKVAILGEPNVGKSTLINKIIGYPVLCVSKKAHTTRQRERAAIIRGNTQVMFVDTPGLVSPAKIKRHKLDEGFCNDGLRAVHEAHMVGVIQDASNPFTRGRIDPNILHVLNNMGSKRAFLIINKVDLVSSKKKLLGLIKRLTTATEEAIPATMPTGMHLSEENNEVIRRKEKDESLDINKPSRSPHHWTDFSEVFLVSALSGDGVSDILDYLVKEAREGDWLLPAGQVTDRPWHVVLQELVRGRLLDHLPYEVPYHLRIETEYFHENELGEMVSVVLVTCPQDRYRRMLLAQGGRIIKKVATLAEEDARAALQAHVRLRVVVTAKQRKKII